MQYLDRYPIIVTERRDPSGLWINVVQQL